MKKIEVTIKPDGSVSIEAFGYKGSECESVTNPIEEALGIVTQKTKKREYYEASAFQNTKSRLTGK